MTLREDKRLDLTDLFDQERFLSEPSVALIHSVNEGSVSANELTTVNKRIFALMLGEFGQPCAEHFHLFLKYHVTSY